MDKYPHSLLEASSKAVGLPNGQMGNSEVGHMNIGAGRVVKQPLQKINDAIDDKTFFQNKNILEIMNHTKKNNSKLHIMGLLSDGGVHSHIDHLMALIDMCKQNDISNVCFHMFLDGRDTLSDISYKFIEQLQKKISDTNIGNIASISGRYYAMDRDNNWDRINYAYDAIVTGKAPFIVDIKSYIEDSYNAGITDEFIKPVITNVDSLVTDNDGIILFNFRPDRVRELFKIITNPFDNYKVINNLKLVTMMSVSDEVNCINAFHENNFENILGDYLSNQGFTQLRIAETEKYAHVTYFFDGGVDKDIKGCNRILIPSPKVATYDLKPEMSAYDITDTLLLELDKKIYDVIILNFANGDMVGHTGNMDATITAVEVVDQMIGRIYEKVNSMDGIMIITADHGNSDYMLDENNNIVTSHSTSLVPFIVTSSKYILKNGKLADIAPTILDIMNVEIPKEMTGESLINNV